LLDRERSLAFYEQRYESGYMESWPIQKKQRLHAVIRGLPLPDRGQALDFGCGNGVLTDVLRQALPPGWSVSGIDISKNAIANASKAYPECHFAISADVEQIPRQFDLCFTHHVLEHVYDLSQALDDIDRRLNKNALMLHVLPCGNAGSLEHTVSQLRRDGVDPALGNRCFFEDEGHLRRLTTAELSSEFAERGFRLAAEYYANQHHGTIEWLTRSPRYLVRFTNVAAGSTPRARRELRELRLKLWTLWMCRYPAVFAESRLRLKRRAFIETALLGPALLLYPFTKPMDVYLRRKAEVEWQERRTDPGGSEMYLFFRRGSE
jgi:trans-aconitate methyltransferase